MEFIDVAKNESSREAWLEERKHYITGTDAAKIIGISPWGGEFSVWLDKTGQSKDKDPSEAMQWGLRLEGDILRAYAEETDCKFERKDGYDLLKSEKYNRIACSLDGWNHDVGCPVDAKNIRWKDEKWGDAWSSDFPDYYKAQLQVQMMVTGAKEAHLAVLFSGQQFVIYKMCWNDDLAEKIATAAEAFWSVVDSGRVPLQDGSDKTSDYLKEKYEVGDPKLEIAPTDEVKWLVSEYVKARDAEKAAKTLKEKYSNRIKGIMGNATIITGFCTWKNSKDSVKTEWEDVAMEAMASMTDEEKEALVAKFTHTSPGNRTLRITAKGVD